MAKRLLGAHFFSGEQSSENARVAMYHAKMEKDSGQVKVRYTFVHKKVKIVCLC